MESKASSQSAAVALTIARSDSSANAGIQTDLKAFSANGAFSAAVITRVTAQNSDGVASIHPAPPESISKTLNYTRKAIVYSTTINGQPFINHFP